LISGKNGGKRKIADATGERAYFRRGKRLKGISEKSTGWIFSVGANKTMQEDLSVAT